MTSATAKATLTRFASRNPSTNPRNSRQQGQSVNRYSVVRAVQWLSLWHQRGVNVFDAHAKEFESQLSCHSTGPPGCGSPSGTGPGGKRTRVQSRQEAVGAGEGGSAGVTSTSTISAEPLTGPDERYSEAEAIIPRASLTGRN